MFRFNEISWPFNSSYIIYSFDITGLSIRCQPFELATEVCWGQPTSYTHICQHYHIFIFVMVYLFSWAFCSWVTNREWFGILAYCLFNEAMTILLGGGRAAVLRLAWALLAVAGARAVSRLPVAVPCSLRWQWRFYNGLLSSDQATCAYHAWRCQYPQILMSLW